MTTTNEISFKATKVFNETWEAVTATYLDAKGVLRRKYRLIEQVGGTRSSKTWSDFQVFFLYGFQNQHKEMVVMRDTAADCRNKVESEWIKWLRDPNARVKEFEQGLITAEELNKFLEEESLHKYFNENKSLHKWTFKHNKTEIIFTGTDDEDRAIGKTQDVLWVNEPYKFSEEVFLQLMQRTTDFGIVDWNPKQNHFIEKQRLKPDTVTFRSTLLDNPFCPRETKKQVLSYQTVSYSDIVVKKLLTDAAAKAYDCDTNVLRFDKKQIKELRRCVTNENQETASAYHWAVYGMGEKAERPNRIFRWKKIPLEQYLAIQVNKVYIGNDWGKVDPWAIVEVKYYDGAMYCRQLNYKSEDELMCKLGVQDMNEIKQEDEGIVRWMYKKLGIKKRGVMILADTNRPLKIAMLRRCGFDTYGANKPAGSILDGIGLLCNTEVYYTSDSPDIEFEQENYSRDVDSSGKTLEEPEDANNHLMDAIRYVALKLQALGILRRV